MQHPVGSVRTENVVPLTGRQRGCDSDGGLDPLLSTRIRAKSELRRLGQAGQGMKLEVSHFRRYPVACIDYLDLQIYKVTSGGISSSFVGAWYIECMETKWYVAVCGYEEMPHKFKFDSRKRPKQYAQSKSLAQGL